MNMKSWTGLTGAADAAARKIGHEYAVFEAPKTGNLTVFLADSKEAAEYLEYGNWEAWCCVVARSPGYAKRRYDRAYLQWRDTTDGVKIR